MITKNLSLVSVQMVTSLCALTFYVQDFKVNEIHAPYDKHHKVSTRLNPRLNASV